MNITFAHCDFLVLRHSGPVKPVEHWQKATPGPCGHGDLSPTCCELGAHAVAAALARKGHETMRFFAV